MAERPLDGGAKASFINPMKEGIALKKDTIEKPLCLANLRDFSKKIITDYLTELADTPNVDQPRLWETEDLFEKERGLGRIIAVYEKLLSKTEQITIEKQSLLMGHLSFVLKRGVDQDLNSPENYVSHAFNHTLNVVDNTDQAITSKPFVLDKISEEYKISLEQARFLLENIALFHDFGYPETELQQMSKVAHSMTGADVLNYGETEVDGKKVPIKEVLARIFGQDDNLNEKVANDIRNSVLLHNADKFDQNYTAKLITDQGDFLVDGDDLYSACNKLTGIKKIIIFDEGNSEKEEQKRIKTRLGDFFDSDKIPKIEWTDKKYKGRKLDPKNKKGNFLGLEYFKVTFEEDPLLAIIRLADNMDMTYDRLSRIQKEPLFWAYLYAIGDRKSIFYEANKRVEKAFETATLEEEKGNQLERTQTAIDILKNKVAAEIATYRVFHEHEGSDAPIDDKDLLRNIAIIKNNLSEQSNADSIISYWSSFIVDRLAKPIGEVEVDYITKTKIKKIAGKIGSTDFPHFAGCRPIRKVEILGEGVNVSVDIELYNELNRIEVEEIVKPNNQVSIVRTPAGQFQLRRFIEAAKGIGFKTGTSGIPVYINERQYNPSELVINS